VDINTVWKIFFLVISAVVLALGGRFFYSFYKYTQFDVSVPAKIAEWQVVEVAPSQFRLVAQYSYFFNTEMEATHIFEKPVFANSFIAHQHMDSLAKQPWRVFLRSKKPFITTLQHNFPFKSCFHFLLSLGVLVYFVWLRGYVSTRYALDERG